MKVADVKLRWTKSPSTDVVKQIVRTTIAGGTTEVELGPEAEEYMVVISASTPFSFSVDTFDSEGNHTASETYTNVIGDLEAPQPAAGLFHEVVGVRDIDAPPPAPPPAPASVTK